MKTRIPIIFLLAFAAAALLAPAAPAAFGPLPGAAGFDVTATALDGTTEDKAGTHPYRLTTTIALDKSGIYSDGDVREIRIDRPPGLVENPTVMGQCQVAQFNTPRVSPFQASLSGESCPDQSQVGTIEVESSFAGGETRTFGLFNLVPPPGFSALLAASPFGMPITFAQRVKSDEGTYQLSLEATDISQKLGVSALKITTWGNPWLIGHDRERGNCLNEIDPAEYFGTDAQLEREPQVAPPIPPFYEAGTCSIGDPKTFPPLAYLTLSTACAAPPLSTLTVSSWQASSSVTRTSSYHDNSGDPLGLGGCDRQDLQREAGSARPTSDRASSASGLDFNLDLNQETLLDNITETGRLIPGVRAPSQVKDAVVAMPLGMTINPSLAAGLGVCTPAQYGRETEYSPPGAGCPNDSKIGELRIESPVMEKPIGGSLFLAKPYDNPFGSLLGLYLVAKDTERAVMIKLSGKVIPDLASGQLTATFERLPQLPYSHFNVHFREGQRSPLATPPACGRYATAIDLVPWLYPELTFGREVPFALTSGIGGGPCPPALAPFAPQAESGTSNRNAGSRSPFYLHLTRTDAEQEITSYSATLPKGLLGSIAGVPFCPEAAIAAAARNGGFAETANPSCPAASKIGHTTAGYGLGSVLAYAPGGLYLAGPYNGSPLSIVAVDSATVGPFDLGVIIIRSAIRIDPRTAEISIDSAGSDPIPHILRGIPLHLRDIRIYIDRPNFMVNPTSCDRFALTSALNGSGPLYSTAADDSLARATNPFQVSFCSSLDFKPRIALRLGGGTRRGAFPSLKATVTPRAGDAGIGKAVVTLPPSLFLEQSHIETICSRVQSAASRCPAGSIYGKARAITPLLDEPLEGPVYLRASDNKLPDLVAELHGRGIRIDVVGRIDSKDGGMRATYDVLPDAPVSKFTLNLRGGKRGLLANSDDACKGFAAKGRMLGQNNAAAPFKAKVGAKCKKKGKSKGKPTKKRSTKKGSK
jgi:hypothetical protein